VRNPRRDRPLRRTLSEFLTRASRRAASAVWGMSQPMRPAERRCVLFARRRSPPARPRRSAKRCWSTTRFSPNFPAGSTWGYDRDHWSSCDSSHWGRVWTRSSTNRSEPSDDNATDRAAVGGVFVALVHRLAHLQSLLLARRFARRLDRARFAGGPRRHRLVLKSRLGVFTLRTRSCGARCDGAGLT